jgi:replication-associated recombination protein RarA
MTIDFTPRDYKEIVLKPQSQQLIDDIVSNKIPFPKNGLSGLVLYGPNGTGKSALAKLLPNPIEQARFQQNAFSPRHEIVRTGNNGASLIDSIQSTVSNVSLNWGLQYIILDEVDLLGEASMKSLKGVMDTENAVFIMTTNNISAIESGVADRSHFIDMTAPPPSCWLPRCYEVFKAYRVANPPPSTNLLPMIAKCNGSARQIITQMEMLAANLPQLPPPAPGPVSTP